MKKFAIIILFILLFLLITGCNTKKKDLFYPEAKNDKIFTTIGGN